MAVRLRRYLAFAGVTRPELFADDATRKPIMFHDLRATGVTWMAIRSDDPLRIMGQAGHVAFSTTQRYVQEAEQLAGRFEAVVPPLPATVLGDDGHDDPSGNRQDDPESPRNEANVSPFQRAPPDRPAHAVATALTQHSPHRRDLLGRPAHVTVARSAIQPPSPQRASRSAHPALTGATTPPPARAARPSARRRTAAGFSRPMVKGNGRLICGSLRPPVRAARVRPRARPVAVASAGYLDGALRGARLERHDVVRAPAAPSSAAQWRRHGPVASTPR
ncbi:hypothetical protein predicted by Glimmer/Critica [Sorangium cellulosum So ce56]|uniref:Uncharacterized protein n=1 Tax=Sorangium cellulosum (strain So ce56) TaxID=448385 RepID=A9G4U8_SORC5|nr:hypothetical protein predicted by Glimmer/Critica [Sorangium cellulosum So ce56]